jgi:hypothetical protein
MRINTNDLTLQRNYLEKFRFLIKGHEQVKSKSHPKFKTVTEFCKAHDTDRMSFLKYYNRYKQSGKDIDLLPQKRGPKYKSRRPLAFIENKVTELREKGNNRYEIVNILKPSLKGHTPSPSGVYNILKRKGMNRLTPVMKKNKRRIIKLLVRNAGAKRNLPCYGLWVSGRKQNLCLSWFMEAVVWSGHEIIERPFTNQSRIECKPFLFCKYER